MAAPESRHPCIVPSLLAADIGWSQCEASLIENCHAGGLHPDVADRHFVPDIDLRQNLPAARRPSNATPAPFTRVFRARVSLGGKA